MVWRTKPASGCSLQRDICAAIDAGGRQRFGSFRQLAKRPGGGGGLTGILTTARYLKKPSQYRPVVHGELSPGNAERRCPGWRTVFRDRGFRSCCIRIRMCRRHTQTFVFATRADGVVWGGADLTPYYPFVEDAAHFHSQLALACDKHDADYYPRFKAWCDDYFFCATVRKPVVSGGIFFDYLRADLPTVQSFWRDAGSGILPAYLPIVERRKKHLW